MKKFVISAILLLLTLAQGAFADSYSSLWEKLYKAEEKDLPQTQMEILNAIAQKAEQEKSYGNLLAAHFSIARLQTSISADSLSTELAKLKREEEKATANSERLLAAVYQAALGKAYKLLAGYTYDTMQRDEYKKESNEYFKRALSNPEMLAKAKDESFVPFVEKGKDSKIFLNDMLHVIAMETSDYNLLHDYYKKTGNRNAACICALKMIKGNDYNGLTLKETAKYRQQIDSLINEYGDLTVAGEIAIERYKLISHEEDADAKHLIAYIDYALSRWGAWPRMNWLRNERNELTRPYFRAIIEKGTALPDVPTKVDISYARHIGELTMTVTRLKGIYGDTRLNADTEKDYKLLKAAKEATAAFTQTRRYMGQPEYQKIKDSMEIKGLPIGMYLVEFTTDNKDIKTERALLRVSNVMAITTSLPHDSMRIVSVNATTGMPIAGAHIRLSDYYNKTATTFTTDKNGELLIKKDKRWAKYFAYTATDRYNKEANYNGYYYYDKIESEYHYERIYTDRSIYRPGQTVHVAVIAFINNDGKKEHAEAHKKIKLTLEDANNKEIDAKEVTTDNFGTAWADFILPDGGLTGTYTVSSENGSLDFQVEEYKRPTFKVEFEKYKGKYANGDSISIKGTAKSFAGVAVQNAKVSYTITRHKPYYFFWLREQGGNEIVIAKGETITDADGNFYVPVKMEMPNKKNKYDTRYFSFDIKATITNQSGESHEGETSLPLSDKPTTLSIKAKELARNDASLPITFIYQNNTGEDINATIAYTIDGKPYSATANKETEINIGRLKLPSGEHTIKAICATDTAEHKFVVFSLTDTKPATTTPDWYYISDDKFKLDGTPVYLQIGSSDQEQHTMYGIYSGNEIIESGSFDQHGGSVRTFRFDYKKEYGDGITLCYAWVHDGKVYTHTSSIVCELPDKELKITWKTFRDKLTPGQRETWTLNIMQPDGKPAKAQLMSVLYDKSLDMIKPHSWQLNNEIDSYLPSAIWSKISNPSINLYEQANIKRLLYDELSFSRIIEKYTDLYSYRGIRVRGGHMLTAAVPSLMDASEAKANNEFVVLEQKSEKKASVLGSVVKKEASENSNNSKKPTATSQVRENLNETAFFYPALVSDGKGNVEIKFTLPESVTTWHFMGIAHDKDMNIGSINADAIAQKTVMVQPNMPRFIREGDKGLITALISNTSKKNASGTAKIEFIDAETGKEISAQSLPFSIEAGKSQSVSFNVSGNNLATLNIVRITASGKGFSDGEQHYLPLLPSEEMVTNTLPISIIGKGLHNFDFSKLFPSKDARHKKLTIEYTNNPAWMMVQALSFITNPDDKNAISLASAYYANAIGRHILTLNPKIKDVIKLWKNEQGKETSMMSALQKNEELKTIVLNETPWIADADNEAKQKQQLISFFDDNAISYRLNNILTELKKLQNADGSFSWWKGMNGSPYMTSEVLNMLVRLNAMTAPQNDTKQIIAKAYAYMDKEMAKEVERMKEYARKYKKELRPSELATHYLYTCALDKRDMPAKYSAEEAYLLKMLKKTARETTIYGKARIAVIFASNSKKDADFATLAKENLQSISEYSVYKEEIGRYFESANAYYSWRDYRIPTQVAAIEAWQMLKSADRKTISEMQRWLLQSKRAQCWDTPINSVNAVYAFLKGSNLTLADRKENATIKVDGKALTTANASAALGYIKEKIEDEGNILTIDKKNEDIAFGAAYAQFMQKSTDIKASGNGLKITRMILKDDKPATSFKVGDKVKVRIEIYADRDYDFVQISDKRSACMEPLNQISGYSHGCYCAPKDNATNYFFDSFAKGKHIIETEYYIDRKGLYDTGTCTAQCAYAPEFSGRTSGSQISVTE
ncbi:MAG: alpha-2-macroglobulin [Prevotella sp.]|nr:alpha-2-macroglobulin [Prevotella sp.]